MQAIIPNQLNNNFEKVKENWPFPNLAPPLLVKKFSNNSAALWNSLLTDIRVFKRPDEFKAKPSHFSFHASVKSSFFSRFII